MSFQHLSNLKTIGVFYILILSPRNLVYVTAQFEEAPFHVVSGHMWPWLRFGDPGSAQKGRSSPCLSGPRVMRTWVCNQSVQRELVFPWLRADTKIPGHLWTGLARSTTPSLRGRGTPEGALASRCHPACPSLCGSTLSLGGAAWTLCPCGSMGLRGTLPVPRVHSDIEGSSESHSVPGTWLPGPCVLAPQ